MRRYKKTAVLMLFCLGGCICTGCSKPEIKAPIKALTRPLSGVDRVVFIEFDQRNSHPGIARGMTTALSHAVKARGLFALGVIDRQDPICEDLAISERGGFTLKQIREMRQVFRCDGLLLGSINDFRPHPRMQLAVSLRMLDLKRGRLLWAVDHVWDTTDKAVEKRIQCFFDDQMRSGYEPVDWQIAMMSPKVFQKFIAYELAQTLPSPVQVAVNAKGGQ